jgi:hypothetical protein
LWPTERLLGFMRDLDGCASAVERSTWPGQSPSTVEIERSADCANGPVIFYRVVGGGHEVPDSLDAGRLLLDFFRDRTSVARDNRAAGSVRALFEKYDLVGAFAHDCGKPVGGGNLYIFHRVASGDNVQREQMSGATRQDFKMVIDRAAESSANELAISGTIEARRFDMRLRIEGKRMRTLESATEGGQTVIVGGHFVNGGAPVPWFSKCS